MLICVKKSLSIDYIKMSRFFYSVNLPRALLYSQKSIKVPSYLELVHTAVVIVILLPPLPRH
jgi:hypothetical protein